VLVFVASYSGQAFIRWVSIRFSVACVHAFHLDPSSSLHNLDTSSINLYILLIPFAVQYHQTSSYKERNVDVLYIGLALLFFAATWSLVKLCERL